MSNPTTLATEYFDAFITTFSENDEIIQAALDDLQAVRERVSNQSRFWSKKYRCVFSDVCFQKRRFIVVKAAKSDLKETLSYVKYPGMQDPACGSYSNAILFYKGYQAIQVHRIAHCLWNKGQKISARALQSRVSEVLAFELSSWQHKSCHFCKKQKCMISTFPDTLLSVLWG